MWALVVQQGLLVRLVRRVRLGLRVVRDRLVELGLQVLLGLRGRVRLAQPVLLAVRVVRVLPVRVVGRVLMDRLALRVRRA